MKTNRRFGITYHLHLQGLLCLPPAFTLDPCSAYISALKMEEIFPPKGQLAFKEIYGVLSLMIVLCLNMYSYRVIVTMAKLLSKHDPFQIFHLPVRPYNSLSCICKFFASRF